MSGRFYLDWVTVDLRPVEQGWRIVRVIDPDHGLVECVPLVGWLLVTEVRRERKTDRAVPPEPDEPREISVVPAILDEVGVGRGDRDDLGELIEWYVLAPGESIDPRNLDYMADSQRRSLARRAHVAETE